MSRRVFIPRKYQERMVAHLLGGRRRALFAGMGTGKTVCNLTAVDALQLAGYSRPALALAPKRVALTTWPDEAEKWDHLSGMTVSPIIGTEKERRAALRRDANLFTVNYENIPWLFEELHGRAWPFGIVIPDESTRLKSARPGMRVSTKGKEYVQAAGAKRVRELARIVHTPAVDYLWENTGTPSPNGLIDLWGQLWFLDKGERLGRIFEAFEQRWFRPAKSGYGVEPFEHSQAEIQERIKDICLTVDFEGELPELKSNTIYVDLPPKARKAYRDMEKTMFVELEGTGVEAFNAATKSMKCLQLANGAAYLDEKAETWAEVHDAKLDALDSIIEEAAGMPVLVAYYFRSDLERIKRTFKQARVLDDKPQTIRDWNKGKIPLLLAHPASAGHGLNLQDGGNILAFFGLTWNLEHYQQVIERIGPVRQMQAGHNRPVYVHHIVARGTVDELVLDRLQTKRAVQDILLEAMRRRG